MDRQQQLLQDGQALGVCAKIQTIDDNKGWWQKSQQYQRSNGRSIGKIILALAATLIGARFLLNAWDGMQYKKVCMAGAVTLDTMSYPSVQSIPRFK